MPTTKWLDRSSDRTQSARLRESTFYKPYHLSSCYSLGLFVFHFSPFPNPNLYVVPLSVELQRTKVSHIHTCILESFMVIKVVVGSGEGGFQPNLPTVLKVKISFSVYNCGVVEVIFLGKAVVSSLPDRLASNKVRISFLSLLLFNNSVLCAATPN